MEEFLNILKVAMNAKGFIDLANGNKKKMMDDLGEDLSEVLEDGFQLSDIPEFAKDAASDLTPDWIENALGSIFDNF